MPNNKIKVNISDITHPQPGTYPGDAAGEIARAHAIIHGLSETVEDLLERCAAQEQFANRATVVIDEMAARLNDYRKPIEGNRS